MDGHPAPAGADLQQVVVADQLEPAGRSARAGRRWASSRLASARSKKARRVHHRLAVEEQLEQLVAEVVVRGDVARGAAPRVQQRQVREPLQRAQRAAPAARRDAVAAAGSRGRRSAAGRRGRRSPRGPRRRTARGRRCGRGRAATYASRRADLDPHRGEPVPSSTVSADQASVSSTLPVRRPRRPGARAAGRVRSTGRAGREARRRCDDRAGPRASALRET